MSLSLSSENMKHSFKNKLEIILVETVYQDKATKIKVRLNTTGVKKENK